jgi:RimJ/RimL family protein N-acetyltransferase
MDYLISWAAENSEIDKIELNVRVSNSRAIRLYESKGFEREGLLKNRIKTPDRQYIDEVLMGLMVAQGAQ